MNVHDEDPDDNEIEEEIEEEIENEFMFRYINNDDDFLDNPDPALDPQPDVDDPYEWSEYNEEPVDDLGYDDISEVFRIHTSNVEIAQNNMDVNRYLQYNNNTFANNIGIVCPICGYEMFNAEQLGSHLMYNHARLFVSLTGLMYPNYTIQDIQNVYSRLQSTSLYNTPTNQSTDDLNQSDHEWGVRDVVYRLMFNDDPDYQPSYEELIELCDYMGYHKEGIVNIEIATTQKNVCDDDSIKQNDTCIICLEMLHSKDTIRKINICGHIFCSGCIEKWLNENKTCPLCKTEI